MSDFVTRAELNGRFGDQSTIRDMLREHIALLQQGQADLSHQVYGMEKEIVARMDEANHRTSTLEGDLRGLSDRIDTQDALLSDGKTAMKEIGAHVLSIERNGCDQKRAHEGALKLLAEAGAGPSDGDQGVDAIDGTIDDDNRSSRPARVWVRKHGRKAAVASGLFGLGAGVTVIMPHVWAGLHWLIHLLSRTP